MGTPNGSTYTLDLQYCVHPVVGLPPVPDDLYLANYYGSKHSLDRDRATAYSRFLGGADAADVGDWVYCCELGAYFGIHQDINFRCVF